jgi:predicted phosphodiesterase
MAVITWLHLSDLHFKSGAEFEEFNQEVVLDSLWIDIERQISSNGLQPDFVVFSGDVVYHGKREEFEMATERFFDCLLAVTGLIKEKLFVVPGNHDLDWGEIDPIILPGMRHLLTHRDQINQFLSPTRDRGLAFRKFCAYAEFVNSYFEGALTFSDTEYFYNRIFDIQGHRIAIIGLNSAWMSAYVKDSQGKVLDQGNLLIGERQLIRALEGIGEADLRIAVLHHPLDWLHEIERFSTERRLRANCDFILHGHWHEPQVEVKHSIAGRAVYIPAGSVYAHRDYPNGYNFVQVDMSTRRGKVYLRRYNDQGPGGPEWVKDILSTGDELGGEFGLTLPQQLEDSASGARRVLLVEDEPEWQKVIGSILVPPDYSLQLAASYAEARAMPLEPFDLIIVNLCLVDDRDYFGEAFLHNLVGYHIPCIVVTGSSTKTRGLFDRYDNVYEVFVKGKTLNRLEFLRVVEEALESYSLARVP